MAVPTTTQAPWDFSGPGECPEYTKDSKINERVLILPVGGVEENKTGFGFLYFFLIAYFFLGIFVASDIFMRSIEIIVSKTKTVKSSHIEDGIKINEKRQVKVWNETIANLTLMALGSSAPEILLSIIETAGNRFCTGALGPGTIVGSASYNLFIITAVCIVSVPNEGTRRIQEYKVFLTTSLFAMVAYIWMVVMIQSISKGEVHIWEAVLTLCMFPVMIGVAYWAELDFCIKGRSQRRSSVATTIHDPSIAPLADAEAAEPLFHFYDEWDNLLDSETGQVDMDVAKELYTKLHNIAVLTDEEIATILAAKLIQSRGHSVLWYRIRAIQALVAGHRSMPALSERLKEVMDALNDIKRNETGRRGDLVPTVTSPETYKTKAVVEFNCSCMAIPSFVGKFTVVVRRTGREDHTVFAKVDSYDGTAKKNDTYTPVSKEIVFEPYVLEHKIGLSVMGDVHKNKDMNFFLKLSLTKESHPSKVALGQMSVMEVVIMDIQQPGDITFMKKGLIVKDTLNIADLEVERVNGSDGTVLAKYVVTPGPKCTRLTEPIEGTLQFEHGEMKKNLQVPLQQSANKAVGQDEQFDVEFVEIVGGAGNIGQNPKVTVAIAADEGFRLEIERVVELAEEKSFLSPIKMQTYKEQIKSSVIVNGGREEAKHATVADKILHYLSVPWKCMFCFLPTPHALGGWPCFVLTLFVIGMLTAVVGDMATIFGYCLSLDPVTTAITVVALGTSLPDTFASRIATVQDKNADAAIGNITGSNSVNVFLGLGLPWTVASIYRQIMYSGTPNEVLRVNADSLAFIVTIYTSAAIIAQFILWLRRQSMTFGLAELGGPAGTKWLTSIILVLCWVTYVFFAIIATQIESVNNIVGSKLGQYLTITKGKYPPPDPPMV